MLVEKVELGDEGLLFAEGERSSIITPRCLFPKPYEILANLETTTGILFQKVSLKWLQLKERCDSPHFNYAKESLLGHQKEPLSTIRDTI
jgi:hypothetical protein